MESFGHGDEISGYIHGRQFNTSVLVAARLSLGPSYNSCNSNISLEVSDVKVPSLQSVQRFLCESKLRQKDLPKSDVILHNP
jgi:hypothetical protein